MNLHAYARPAIQSVNPDVLGQIIRADGTFDTLTDGTKVPGYADPVDGRFQVQPLSPRDLRHLEGQGLNTALIDYAVYVNGEVTGVDREEQTGGDLLVFNGRTWLVTAVLEAWSLTAGWTKVAVTKQVTP